MAHHSIPFQKNTIDLNRLSTWLNKQDRQATLGLEKASSTGGVKLTAHTGRVSDGLARLQGLAKVFDRIRSRRTSHNMKILKAITDAARDNPLLANSTDAQEALNHLSHLFDTGRAYQGKSLRVKDVAEDIQTLNLALKQAEIKTARGTENRANLALQQLASVSMAEVADPLLAGPSLNDLALAAAQRIITNTADHWNGLYELAAEGFGGPARSPAQRAAEDFVTALAKVASTNRFGDGYVPPNGVSPHHLLLDKGRAAIHALTDAPAHAHEGLSDTTNEMVAIANGFNSGQHRSADIDRFQKACQAHAARFEHQVGNLIRLAATLMMPGELGRLGPQESAILRRYGESLMVVAGMMMDPNRPVARDYQLAKIGATRPTEVLSALGAPAIGPTRPTDIDPAAQARVRTASLIDQPPPVGPTERTRVLRAQSTPQRRLAAAQNFHKSAKSAAPAAQPVGNDPTSPGDVNDQLDDLLAALDRADADNRQAPPVPRPAVTQDPDVNNAAEFAELDALLRALPDATPT